MEREIMIKVLERQREDIVLKNIMDPPKRIEIKRLREQQLKNINKMLEVRKNV